MASYPYPYAEITTGRTRKMSPQYLCSVEYTLSQNLKVTLKVLSHEVTRSRDKTPRVTCMFYAIRRRDLSHEFKSV